MSSSAEPAENKPDWQRRIALALLAGFGITVVYTLLYQWAMATYAGVHVSFLHSLRVVIESLTTAGFGGDTDYWQTAPLHLLVVTMNLSGVLLVFLALPLFVVPMFRQVFQTRPPIESHLTDHVIICGYSPQDEFLRKELEAVGIPCLYITSDSDRVTELIEEGINAIVGNPERIDGLVAANAGEARALVSDIADEINPTVILSAKQLNPGLRTISVIRKPEVEPFHRYASADEVVLNRRILGKSLGLHAARTYAEKLREVIEVEGDIQVTELRLEPSSDLVGQTLREAKVIGHQEVNVIGMWLGGKFLTTPDPDTVLEPNTILLIAGTYDGLENIRAQSIPTHEDDVPRVVVCGHGTVGQSITETLHEEDIDVEVIDIASKAGVDVIGDIADPETFEQADVENARAVVLSIDEDVTTIYATLILNEIAPSTEIIARADDAESVQKLYNAGADFVLSLPAVTGEILASLLIDELEIITPDIDMQFTRIVANGLAGQSIGELDVRRQTDCTVVATERDGELLTNLGPDFVIQKRDALIVVGSEEAHRRFRNWLNRRTGGS